MEKNRLDTFCFLLGCVLLLQLVYSIHSKFEANVMQSMLNERMSNMEATNRKQDKEISNLKTSTVEDKYEISKLRGRVDQLEGSAHGNVATEDIVERQERPARLLPASFLYGKRKNQTEEVNESNTTRFYGPPTSCSELGKLGYTLNGYYLINGTGEYNNGKVVYCRFKEPPSVSGNESQLETKIGIAAFNSEVKVEQSNFKGMPTSCKDLQLIGHKLNGIYSVKVSQPDHAGTKIESVFCDFQSIDVERLQTRIGIVDVKSSYVHFNVQSYGNYVKEGQKITFDYAVLNVGNGFEWNNQWFKVPYPGIYFFSISGSKGHNYKKGRTCIDVKVNSEVIYGAAISSDFTSFGGFSYQFSRKLNADDKVELVMKFGEIYFLAFTGWILDESLVF